MLAPDENGETLSLLIRPEWYPDFLYKNTCFSDSRRFGIRKKFFEAQMWRNFACLLRNICSQIAPGVTRCILSLIGFPCNRVRVRVI